MIIPDSHLIICTKPNDSTNQSINQTVVASLLLNLQWFDMVHLRMVHLYPRSDPLLTGTHLARPYHLTYLHLTLRTVQLVLVGLLLRQPDRRSDEERCTGLTVERSVEETRSTALASVVVLLMNLHFGLLSSYYYYQKWRLLGIVAFKIQEYYNQKNNHITIGKKMFSTIILLSYTQPTCCIHI